MTHFLQNHDRRLSFDSPRIMGILNVTPDSFSDGGKFFEGGKLNIEAVTERALAMIEEGADILDVGGESTGPGSKDVSLEEELSRVIPVVRALRGKNKDVWISVDTWKSEVARQAIEAGADMVNDVTALRGDSDLARVVERVQIPLVLMYSKDSTPRTTRNLVSYKDVVKTIKDFLERRVHFAESAGIQRDHLIIDPGMGAFVSGKPQYSFEILSRLSEFHELNLPILVGASRKSFLGGSVEEREEKSLAAALASFLGGVHIVRVHDVKATRCVRDFFMNLHESLL